MTQEAEMMDFDHVSIQVGEGFNLVSKENYLLLPASERVQHILNRKVQFLHDGTIVPTKLALKSLQARKMSVIDHHTLVEISGQK